MRVLPVRAHLHRAHGAKVDAEGLEERAGDAEASDPPSAALPALSSAIARSRGTIDETQLKAARAVGVTDAEIAGDVGNPALNILTSYFNILADTDTSATIVM